MHIAQKERPALSRPLKLVTPVGFPVLGWRTSHDLNEFADKIVAVLVSDVFCNTVYLLIRIDNLAGSFPDPVICQVVFERLPVFFPEYLS